MMEDLETMITAAASSVFRANSNIPLLGKEHKSRIMRMPSLDPILVKASSTSIKKEFLENNSDLKKFIKAVFADKEFELILPCNLPCKDGYDLGVYYSAGMHSMYGCELIYSLFSTAFRYMFFLDLPNKENIYIETVREGFEQLRKAVKGEPVQEYEIKGLAQITIPQNSYLSTPWGCIKPPPLVEEHFVFSQFGKPNAQALLIEVKQISGAIRRLTSPNVDRPLSDERDSRSSYLLPLSFALASKDHMNPVTPIIVWSIFLVPFIDIFTYSAQMFSRPIFGQVNDVSKLVDGLEKWAQLIYEGHNSKFDVAAKRLVSAVAHRTDKADALIDTVMVWENLFGTSSEVSFRVCASLAKLIKSKSDERIELIKSLKSVYGTRSKIVHGAVVGDQEIQNACSTAIGTAILALRESYQKGPKWISMSSEERSNEILLV